MVAELAGLAALVFVAASVGTLTGFGTSTIIIPVLLLFFPLSLTLLFVAVIHWFGDIWKMLFFRRGVHWRLLFLFGAAGIVMSYLGASFVVSISNVLLSRFLGFFLLVYVAWLWRKPDWKLPGRDVTAVAGGALSGFLAGVFGVGGAVRSAFLAAFDLPKETYLFTSGAIALVIDSTRLLTYWTSGTRLSPFLVWGALIGVLASLAGAYIAKRIVDSIPQASFRIVIAVFLAVAALKLLTWP